MSATLSDPSQRSVSLARVPRARALSGVRWLTLVVLAALCGCEAAAPARTDAPVDTAAGEMPIEWAGPNQAAIVVPVHINGEGPYSFVLDTGATMTCVDEEVAAALSLPESPGRLGVGAGIGRAGRMTIADTDSVRVGAATAEDLPVCVLDLSGARQIGVELDGLLGLNFLREYRMVLDFERDVLMLHQP